MEKKNHSDKRSGQENSGKRQILPLAVSHAKSAGAAGEACLASLDELVKEGAAEGPEYREELSRFLSCEYGFQVNRILPAKRGFYGETWDIQTDSGIYFLKIDYWAHHQAGFQNSLPVIRYMAESGISFIPKIIAAKGGPLSRRFRQGTAAVFEHIPGQLSEDCPAAQLYGLLAQVYRLRTDGLALAAETFGTEELGTFQHLQSLPGLPGEVKAALAGKGTAISRYGERLTYFSAACRGSRENFHITHGDAGGNCIRNGNQLFLVDWDSAMLAPIERDAWIFICDDKELACVQSALAAGGVGDILEQNRLCYYCYDFFFYYLNAYLKAMFEAGNEGRKEEIAQSLTGYLADCWIYQRLEKADTLC